LLGDVAEADEGTPQLCIAIECPQISLASVVDAMVKKGGYQHDVGLRKKYAAKICAVLRLIAKAVRYLHRSGVIHGNICMANCGKFEHSWKLLGCMGLQRIGDAIDPKRFHQSFPPEVLQIHEDDERVYDSDYSSISFRVVEATPSIDVWAFGKLAFEALVGKPLVEFHPSKNTTDDVVSLLEILEWDQDSMKRVFTCLLDAGVTESCAELVTSCLFPSPEDRPADMDVILEDPFWKDMRQYRERTSPSKRSREETASSTFTSASSKSIFTETASAVDTSQEMELVEI
jgi:serine/threonine protein kinase